jgi:hypothetical protein
MGRRTALDSERLTTRIPRLTLALFLLLAASSIAQAQQLPYVTIESTEVRQQDATTRYRYRVINRGSKPIVGFAIGRDAPHDLSELKVPPEGWSIERGLPGSSTSSPPGWRASVITTEESAFIELEWRNDGNGSIPPGQTLDSFEVVTPQPDHGYLTGHWTAFLSDSSAVSSTLSHR